MRHGFSLCVGLGIVVWCLSGCAGNTGDGNDDGALTSARYCARHATLTCAAYVECGCWSSQNDCVESFRADCDDFAADEAQRGRTLDAARAEQCLVELESSFADCALVDATRFPGYQYCDAFRGNVAQGSECLESTQCAEPPGTVATCILDQPNGGGLCNQAPRAELGGACDPSGFYGPFCADGLWCPSESSRCEAPRALGEPCESVSPQGEQSCVEGLYCSPMTMTCSEPAAAGEPCEQYFLRSTCVAGHDCQNEEAVCQPALITEFGICE